MVAWRSSSAAWRMGTRRTTGPGDPTPPHFLLLRAPSSPSLCWQVTPLAGCLLPPAQGLWGRFRGSPPQPILWAPGWSPRLAVIVTVEDFCIKANLYSEGPSPPSSLLPPGGSGRDKLYIFIPNKILFLKARFALCKRWGWERKSGMLGADEAGPQGSQMGGRSGGHEHPPRPRRQVIASLNSAS